MSGTPNKGNLLFSAKALAVTALGVIVVISLLFWLARSRKPLQLGGPSNQAASKPRVVLGAADRPESYARRESQFATLMDEEADQRKRDLMDLYGTTPTLEPSSSEMAQQTFDAIRSGEDLRVRSPHFEAEDFNRESFLKDPPAYLRQHVPGRVFQSATPGPGVPVLTPESKQRHLLRRGESVRLSVRTEPGMPATFASFDVGLFENGLATITVQADDSGIASANFNAAPGKLGEVNILAASPVASEEVRFTIFVPAPTLSEK